MSDADMQSWRSLLVTSLAVVFAAAVGSLSASVQAAADAASDMVVAADGGCCGSARSDDVWLISTRHLGCPSWDKEADVDLHVEHYGGKGTGWIETSLDEFFASSDPAQRTMVYVHGNRVDWNDAIERAWHVRNAVLGCSPIEPIRYVIWSWPSDQIHGQLRDIRAKAMRTNGEAYYLAAFLAQLDPAAPLSILGYSYGARVTTGALDLLGGGELPARSWMHGASPRVRVALLAAAVHNYWLQPGACHGQALAQIDRLLIQYNSCDPVLKRYKFVEKHGRAQALGYTGMYVDESLNAWIEQRDVCCIVGKSHAEARYFESPALTDEIREALFTE